MSHIDDEVPGGLQHDDGEAERRRAAKATRRSRERAQVSLVRQPLRSRRKGPDGRPLSQT